jgi:hypothetical protein
MLFEYLSGEVAFPLSVLELASACVSLLTSTPLRSRKPTDGFGPIYNPFDTCHLYSNSFVPLASLPIWVWSGTRRNHFTRDAVPKGSALFAGETKCGAFGSGLASVDGARNPGTV